MSRRTTTTTFSATAVLVAVLVAAMVTLNTVLVAAAAAESDSAAGIGLAADDAGLLSDGKPLDWDNMHVIKTMAGIYVGVVAVFLVAVTTCAWCYMTRCPKMYM